MASGVSLQGVLGAGEARLPVHIDGVLVFYSAAHHAGLQAQSVEQFDQLKEGMTLREIVTLLGPGSQDKLSGIGFVCWRCKDGRSLQVWPIRGLDEKVELILRVPGQRHADVARLAKSLIAKLKVVGQEVEVVLTQDTQLAKAHQAKVYRVGQTFQKVDPLPRLDFTIMKIEADVVHCRYFYSAAPEGMVHHSEYGNLMLRNIERRK